MKNKKDGLRYAVGRANLTGSFKTVHNHRQEAQRFVDALRLNGQGVTKWVNVTNKHVGLAVSQWKDEGLSAATIKNYLAGVRALCRAYGNDRIAPDNAAFGVQNRVYIDNRDKSVSERQYANAVAELECSGDALKERVAMMLRYQRTLGMRMEESIKFNPIRDCLGNQAHIHVGTKGGRPRWLKMNGEQRDLIEAARESGFYNRVTDTIIPKGRSERQWVNFVYKSVAGVGLTKGGNGTMHGLRHAYAQDRFVTLTGFDPPVKYDSLPDYQAGAFVKAGEDFGKLQDKARAIISEELGHSRMGIVSQYLGSFDK